MNRSADGTWSANLAALVTGWKEHFENIEAKPAEVWDETTDTVAWSKGTVWPTVTYDYDTGYDDENNVRIKMNVTLTLVPLGVGTEADVTGTVVKSNVGVISGTEITVKLPAGSPLPTAGEIAVTLSPYAAMTNLTTTDDGRTWTFTVTSEDGKTKKNHTLYIVYGDTRSRVGEDDHGTVTASPNPARMGDTVTLTVTPDPGYMLTGWEVVLGDVTVREDNTFVMPSGAVILRPIFAPIPVTPPQTGDDSHTACGWRWRSSASAACARRRGPPAGGGTARGKRPAHPHKHSAHAGWPGMGASLYRLPSLWVVWRAAALQAVFVSPGFAGRAGSLRPWRKHSLHVSPAAPKAQGKRANLAERSPSGELFRQAEGLFALARSGFFCYAVCICAGAYPRRNQRRRRRWSGPCATCSRARRTGCLCTCRGAGARAVRTAGPLPPGNHRAGRDRRPLRPRRRHCARGGAGGAVRGARRIR